MNSWVALLMVLVFAGIIAVIFGGTYISKLRRAKKYERGLKMVPLLIHLPPTTDDIDAGSRDERDIADEAISKAQVMYSILSSTLTKGAKSKIYGQRHFSLEIIAKDGFIRYYAIVPAVLTETVKQAIQSAYPTARVEIKQEENIFRGGAGVNAVAGAEPNAMLSWLFSMHSLASAKTKALLYKFCFALHNKIGQKLASNLLKTSKKAKRPQNHSAPVSAISP